MDIQPGQFAPGFSALAVGGEYGASGKQVNLGEYAGRTLVLYFYPKDDTPGCTAQACALRDRWGEFAQRVALLGVSPDDVESHNRFVDKHRLPFALLSDDGHHIAAAYGVWVEKSMYGKKYWGVERSTFVIGPDGRIIAVARKVKPDAHADWLAGVLA